MKKNFFGFGKNQLDEMQERKLSKIEGRGFWLAFCLLLAAMTVQSLCGAPSAQMAGEWFVFMAMCIYLLATCLHEGIWDRKLKPDLKTNLIASAIGGAAVFVFTILSTYRWGTNPVLWVRLVAGLVAGAFTWALTFGLLQISAAYYRRRLQKLENESDEETTEPNREGK